MGKKLSTKVKSQPKVSKLTKFNISIRIYSCLGHFANKISYNKNPHHIFIYVLSP